MRRRQVVAVAAILASALARADAIDQQAPFRAATDLVTVDVTVRSGGNAIGGLTAADFALLDNGVPQKVESVDRSTLPVDVTLVFDVSGGFSGVMADPKPDEATRVTRELAAEVARTQKVLRPEDRLRLLTIDDYATQVVPMRAATASASITKVATGGLASLHDALVSALLYETGPNRRHFVVAFTKGFSTIGAADGTTLREVARRADALLYVVQDDGSLLSEDAVQDCQCLLMNLCRPTTRFWLPVRRRTPDPGLCKQGLVKVDSRPRDGRQIEVLAEAAASTGGQLFGSGFFASRDPIDTFKSIFDDFRQGYVLRYTPQGVRREGWHEIAVTIPRQPSYVVQARRGYAVEIAAPTATPLGSASTSARGATPAPASGRGAAPVAATLESVAEAYARRDYAAVSAALRQPRDLTRLLRDYRAAGTAWPSAPRLDAVFALELALSGLASLDNDAREEGQRLLTQYATLVRQPFGANGFECAWYWTASVGLQSLIQPTLALPFVSRAVARCPSEPRLHLAHAIVVDQRWPLGTTTPTPGSRFVLTPTAEQERDVPRLYQEAMTFPSTAAEARVRAGFFAYRTGQLERALELLDPAQAATQDRPVQYLAALFRGHALRAQDRRDAAAASYRIALAVWPGAQSARVALLTTLVEGGDHEAAGALALQIQTAPDAQFDPWWQYWQGDFRAFPGILDRLRGMAR